MEVVMVVKYKFQRQNGFSPYTYPKRSAVLSFDSHKLISNETIIQKLKNIELKSKQYGGAGYEILDISILSGIQGKNLNKITN